jgi:predicted amidohydrolase
MKIAAAQISANDEDVQANIRTHIRWSEEAAAPGAELIVFPELSLTGYHIERAREFRFTPDDPRLQPLQETADRCNIHIVAGAPVEIEQTLHIGAFILRPHQPALIYTKQFLHAGEEKAFAPSFDFNPVLELAEERIAFAICADISHPEHGANAARNKATTYVAGIFCTPGGIENDHSYLMQFSLQHQLRVVMANYVGTSYQFPAAGRSGYWNSHGALIKQLGTSDEGLLLTD